MVDIKEAVVLSTVSISRPDMDMTTVPKRKVPIYRNTKLVIEETVLALTLFVPIFIV